MNRSDWLTWACIDSVDSKGKAKMLRGLDTRGGLWTIEQGEIAGKLHLNVLCEGLRDAAEVAEAFGAAGVGVWAKPVPGCDVRSVAAYVSKRSQYPTEDAYGGRTFGTFGEWRGKSRRLSEVIESAEMVEHAPAVVAMSLEQQFGGGPEEAQGRGEGGHGVVGVPTMEEAREIARRHLPGVFAMLGRR